LNQKLTEIHERLGLSKRLWNKSRKTIATKEEWEKQRPQLRAEFKKAICGRTITSPLVVAILSERLADREAA
jgi:hypothetical protein